MVSRAGFVCKDSVIKVVTLGLMIQVAIPKVTTEVEVVWLLVMVSQPLCVIAVVIRIGFVEMLSVCTAHYVSVVVPLPVVSFHFDC